MSIDRGINGLRRILVSGRRSVSAVSALLVTLTSVWLLTLLGVPAAGTQVQSTTAERVASARSELSSGH